jgi:hypothetical protein
MNVWKKVNAMQEDNNWAKKYDAPKGKEWVCCACGKRSSNKASGPHGWDESCFLNAVLDDVR